MPAGEQFCRLKLRLCGTDLPAHHFRKKGHNLVGARCVSLGDLGAKFGYSFCYLDILQQSAALAAGGMRAISRSNGCLCRVAVYDVFVAKTLHFIVI